MTAPRVGTLIRETRKALKMTLGDLAEAMSIGVADLSAVESGSKPLWPYREGFYVLLARALGLDSRRFADAVRAELSTPDQKRVLELLALLRRAEWNWAAGWRCPICGDRGSDKIHADGCDLAAALEAGE